MMSFTNAMFIAAFLVVCGCNVDAGRPVLVDEKPAGSGAPQVNLPVHGEPREVNSGANYVYGEIYASGNCLYVTYVDEGFRRGPVEGLLVVWPSGFRSDVSGGTVGVVNDEGVRVASVGDTVRITGRSLVDLSDVNWRWESGKPGKAACPGPYWLVGDEVTGDPIGDDGSFGPVDYFPRLPHRRGPILVPGALWEGKLVIRGGCLRVAGLPDPDGHAVVWPPGFRAGMVGADVVVLNGGGNAVARVGDRVRLGGGRRMSPLAPEGSPCDGSAFRAYKVLEVR